MSQLALNDDDPYSDEGGPAFPLKIEQGTTVTVMYGMSLRDWFAGRIAAAMVDQFPWDQIGANAYHIADKMLAEREKGRKP